MAFSDPKMYDKLYNLKNFGIRGEELVVSVGANAKMNEFSAIMGLCNLKHIDGVIQARKERYELYTELLKDIPGIKLFDRNENATNNYAYFPILVEQGYGRNRDELYDYLKENDIYARKYFYPITADAACFKNKYKNTMLTIARNTAKNILVLPMYEKLEMKSISEICNIVKRYEREGILA